MCDVGFYVGEEPGDTEGVAVEGERGGDTGPQQGEEGAAGWRGCFLARRIFWPPRIEGLCRGLCPRGGRGIGNVGAKSNVFRCRERRRCCGGRC